jgi:hypothetical protein
MIDDLLDHFGSQYRMAKELGVDRGAVSQWVKNHAIPPQRLIQLERLTEGKFKAVDLDDWQQSMLTPTIGNKYPLPTDKQIVDTIAQYSHRKGALHKNPECVKIAFAFLDAQVKTKKPCSEGKPLKHIIEGWAGTYVSMSDVEMAAILHPEIQGEYPYFNISNRLVFPCYERLKGLTTPFKEKYKPQKLTFSIFECPEQCKDL